MKVLVNAYAVSPSWGSEPGMGWNWIINIAAYANLYVITEGEWEKEIEAAVEKHPHKKNLHFYYLPVSDKIRKMCWNQGDWRFYYHYKQWERRAFEKAKEIIDEVNIDVVHQLNMVGFREPGYMWKLGKPLVWGPIGGMGETPYRFLEGTSWKQKAQLFIKDFITTTQLKFFYRINQAFKQSNVLISAVPIAQKKIKRYKHRDSILIPETGCYNLNVHPSDKRQREDFHILWVGRFIYTKRLDIALRSIAEIKHLYNIHFHIAGTGSDKIVNHYKAMSQQLGIDGLCKWHGVVENSKVHEMMRKADVFFFTSIREATSTVVPEAINNCLPIVCFDTCGFGPLVTDKIGLKVKMSNPEQAVKDFALNLETLYHNKQLLFEMSNNCKEVLKALLWEDKAKKMAEVYSQCLS